MEGRMKFTASGDALIMRNFPENYEGYEAVKDFIGQGEARITNLETTLTERDCFPSTFSGGTWLTAPENVLDDLEGLGFNFSALPASGTVLRRNNPAYGCWQRCKS